VLAVLASRHDRSAEALLARWDERAALISCEDLSTPGWRFDLEHPADGTAVVQGRVVRVADIDGVLTRRPSVAEEELIHVVPADRRYVAAEMNAFLLAWLTALPRPVVNRPSTTSLLGPHWRREQWVRAAVSLGIPSVPSRRVAGPVSPTPSSTTVGQRLGAEEPAGAAGVGAALTTGIVIVGERWFGDAAPELGDRAIRLARHAGAPLLEVWFEHPGRDARLIDAHPYASLAEPGVADAVLDVFSEHAAVANQGGRG
jgi:hypothetical protein